MKELLGSVGVAALICLPCLAVIAGVSVVAFGGALVTFALNPFAQASGVLVAIGGLAAAGWYTRTRRACPQCEIERTQGASPETLRHELHT